MTKHPDDTIAWVTVRLHAHGAVSVGGTLGDRNMAITLLEHAKDAIRRQVPEAGELVVPNRDVCVQPSPTLRELGDLSLRDRGDT